MALTFKLPVSEQRLLEEACAAFRRASGRFTAKPVKMTVRADRSVATWAADGELVFDINGKRLEMPFSIRERLGQPGDIAKQRRPGPEGSKRPIVYVTRFVPPERALELIAEGVLFLDTAGNAYVDGPEGTVMIIGRSRPAPVVSPGSARSTTPKGMQVMYAIATTSGLVAQPYRTIAEVAGVALNTVNKAVDDLIARGLVAEKRSGARIVPDWKRFVGEWVNLYPSQLRRKLGSRRFASISQDWWRNFDFSTFAETLDLRLGGEAAAEALTHQLKAAGSTVYSRGALPAEFMRAARLRPDDHGDVEILEAFWPRASSLTATPAITPPLVHPLLIYADLIATGDSRNLSIAEQIYDEHVAPVRS